jgi:hypothetical protein
MRLAVLMTRQAISPRFAMRILLNILGSRGEIARARCACKAIWLRRCAAVRLVAAIGYQFFREHGFSPK